jgi:dTDP-4-dehydrorhamnose reductase
LERILVSGANGQLGKCLQRQARNHNEFEFHFLTSSDWDITDNESTRAVFDRIEPDILINCAAYTNVDGAEDERKKVFAINADALLGIVNQCNQHDTFLIHISTDYVFNGKTSSAYKESDACDPINTYGQSKRQGEQVIEQNARHAAIVRTSWLYSAFGKNFLTSMLALGKQGVDLKIVNNQFGSPTNANDLANFLLKLARQPASGNQYFHFCNSGKTNWHDFADAIFKVAGIRDQVTLAPTDHYPTKAERPENSLLDCTKIADHLKADIPHWRESLAKWYDRDKKDALI